MEDFKKGRAAFVRLPLVVAVLGCLYGVQAGAQTETDEEEETVETTEETTDETTDLERLQVTGSLLRRKEYDSASPLTVITADTKTTVGQVSTADFLQKSSVAAGSTQINNQFGGFVIGGGSGVQTVSLRGLGSQRTLVVLNNRRPGASGTRGQVGAFDLNVIPSNIVQRIEILKDGASSIYGSDAVAGVANIITRNDITAPEISITGTQPFEGGGEEVNISAATGWQFDNGNIAVAAQWYRHEPLKVGDRDFFECAEDRIWDGDGNRVDREDRSITAGTDLSGCNNLYANTVIDALDSTVRFIPSPGGETIGLIPGYRPRTNERYDTPGGEGQAFYEDVTNFDFYGQEYVLNKNERFSLYGKSDFDFNSVSWDTEWLYTRRETDVRFWRQFFPLTGGSTAPERFQYTDGSDFASPVESGVAQPIMPFPWNTNVKVDYFYVASGLDGTLPFGNYWNWNVDASYSYSDGDYTRKDSIVGSRTGDLDYSGNAPTVDYFDPCILSGECMDTLVDTLGASHTGNTIYDQFVVTGVVGGDLFDLPAGPVSAAFGTEYRYFSIDDQPSDLVLSGDLWGESSAGRTKGDDFVVEGFGEIEVPIITGKPGFESLSFNGSARVFDYDSVSGSDYVWKAGLNWQIVPTLRMRATRGTSYRAPGLFELFLADQTGFTSQLGIDPCIDWGTNPSATDNLRANCAADGIPDDYTGAGSSSALVVSSGGEGQLEPETSDAFTVGAVFTPTFANLSVAVDYFEFKIEDQIDQLGPGQILGGCYDAQVFPNAFCDFVDRNAPDDPTEPNKIETVRNPYININSQETKGFDLNFRYDNDFSFGNLEVEGEATYIFEDIEQTFDSADADGFEDNDRNGTISRPQWVGNLRTALKRGDWTYTWFIEYVGRADDSILVDEVTSYLGFDGVRRDIRTGRRIYHTASVLYEHGDDWSVLAGVNNLLDSDPPLISSGIGRNRAGNTSISASQYDWYGRRAFLRFNYFF